MLALICDDNKTNIAVYQNILSRIDDLQCQGFTSSSAAMVWCETHEPDLLIFDYRMPEPDGIECIRRYRTKNPDAETPIIMITSDQDRVVRHRALDLGASDFLTKPADPVDFLARARNLLLLHQSRRRLKDRNAALSDEVERAMREIVDREEETVHTLMRAAEFRDNETGMHIVRMGHFASRIGKELGMSSEQQRFLLLAAPMHDIGKVSTPDEILLKPAKLTPAEWEIMKRHARAGYDILRSGRSRVLRVAAQIALGHHERWDGSGYPSGIQGTDIPLEARITAVGDVFDALISDRPYKRAWTLPEAYAAVAGKSGTHFDPMIVEAFLACRADIGAIAVRFADEQAA